MTNEEAITKFATMILHGDDIHREWLLEAAQAFNAGLPMPPPRSAPTPKKATDPKSRSFHARPREKVRVIARKCGGYLALSPAGEPLQIGVIGDTEENALRGLEEATAQWQLLADLAKEPTP